MTRIKVKLVKSLSKHSTKIMAHMSCFPQNEDKYLTLSVCSLLRRISAEAFQKKIPIFRVLTSRIIKFSGEAE